MSSTDQQSPKTVQSGIAFGSAPTSLDALADDEFLQSIRWRKSANSGMVRAARDGDVIAFTKRLLKRAGFAGGTKIPQTGKRSADVCLTGPDYFNSEIRPALRDALNALKTHKGTKRTQSLNKTIEHALGEEYDRAGDVHALMELLIRSGPELEQQTFFKLWRTTFTAACRFLQPPSLSADGDPGASADEQLLQAGEIPWQVGLLFGDIKGAGKRKRAGRKFIRRELAERTDGDGTPHSKLMPSLGHWLAGLIRSARWADRFQATLWDDDSSVVFNDLLAQTLRLARPDGSLAMSNGFSTRTQSLFEAASRLAGSEFKIAKLSFAWGGETNGDGTNGRGTRKTKGKTSGPFKEALKQEKLRPSSQSDWAELACLRSDWSEQCNSIVIDYNGKQPRIDMTVLGKALFEGDWEITIAVDGVSVPIEAQWTAICWNTDDDCDYLELQQTFAGQGHVERQILLSRDGNFALFADSLVGFKGERIEYTARFPLAGGLETNSDAPTRETRIKAKGGVLTRVFPLGLPQDRVHSTPGGCGVFGNHLVHKQVVAGGGLYAPLVFDWDPGRRRKASQWRRLTVTEDGQILKGDTAAGFRVRVGQQHLLAYRSLIKSGQPRSVLGYHTLDETVIGQFDDDGDVTPLLLVE